MTFQVVDVIHIQSLDEQTSCYVYYGQYEVLLIFTVAPPTQLKARILALSDTPAQGGEREREIIY